MPNCKKRHLRGDTCQSTKYLPLAVSVSEDKILFLLFLPITMVDLKQQRNRVYTCVEIIKTNQLERPFIKI